MQLRGAAFEDGRGGDGHFVDVFLVRQVEHGIEQGLFDDGAQAACAGFAGNGFLRNGLQRVWGEFEGDVLKAEDFFKLAHDGVFRLGEDVDERVFVQGVQQGDDGQAADEFGNEAEFDEVFRFDLL